MATSRSYDGRLPDWEDVQDEEDWDVLLLGNGLSINVWGSFEYRSLFETAKSRKLFSKDDIALFDALGSSNFEQVLHSLSESIRVGRALGEERRRDIARYQSVQKALGRAVHSVHIERGELPGETLDRIKKEMRLFKHVFTTSYDLLLYWAVMYDDRFMGFLDFFWAHGNNAFDESTHTFSEGDSRTRLYFLHGALHLVAHADGTTCKRKSSFRTLLDQFGLPHAGDATARTLIVTEARAEEKELSILANEYLSFCWRTLRGCDAPVVIFGHSLSPQDSHLIAALNEHERPIAVALRDKKRSTNKKEQHRIASLLDTQDLHFFNASSHTLGSKERRVKENPFLRRVRRPFAA
jgi:hypothetical protein